MAVAAGAAIGLLLAWTPMERRALGETRDQLVERAESTVNEALDRVDEQTPGGESSATNSGGQSEQL